MNATGECGAGLTAHPDPLSAAVDRVVRDAQASGHFGEVGLAFSTVMGSWMEPLAAAMRAMEPTARSQAAARAMADLARATGEFADQAMRASGDLRSGAAASEPDKRHAELAGRIDDSFRTFSSSPDFDRVRRNAAAAILDWLEHDRAAAARIVLALETAPTLAPEHFGDAMPPDPEPVVRDGHATRTACPGAGQARAALVVVPGFTVGARAFDLHAGHSVVRTLAEHGIATWLLDWGVADESDRSRTVTDHLARIDRAVEAAREASHGARPALAGHFHGGLLALLYCIRHPDKAGALITLSTPVEFASDDDAFAAWLRACGGERLADVLGTVPGPLVAALVAASSPMRWCGGGFLELLGGLDSADAAARIARFERARRFPPAIPGATFRGLYRAFYRDNAFATQGAAVIDGHRFELARLETPLLNVFARDDRIVPPVASTPLGEWVRTVPRSSLEHRGGHFDLLAGSKVHDALLPGLAAWLIKHAPGT